MEEEKVEYPGRLIVPIILLGKGRIAVVTTSVQYSSLEEPSLAGNAWRDGISDIEVAATRRQLRPECLLREGEAHWNATRDLQLWELNIS